MLPTLHVVTLARKPATSSVSSTPLPAPASEMLRASAAAANAEKDPEEVDVMSMSDLRRRNLLQYVDTGSKRTYDDDDDRKEGGSPEWSARDRSRSGVFSMLSEERQRVLGPDRDEY